ncbi:MAG TPA: CGNR zinc finger domain-containing protein [Thermoleophilaceae bacterium]|nr:CGNR zinc finger domain-containing protein [Thermoleophilaceae bacterium]
MAPGESAPEKTAPEPLRQVQRLVNSIDLESGEDELDSPESLRAWLCERGLMGSGERVGPADLRRALDVREGLRALLLQNNGLELDERKVERLDSVAARAGVRVRFRAGRDPELAPAAGGVDGALARLLAIAASAVEKGTWARLKACPREDCEWAFYDRSKNRSGRWCRMEDCGNIAKARAFRERRRAGERS